MYDEEKRTKDVERKKFILGPVFEVSICRLLKNNMLKFNSILNVHTPILLPEI